MFTDDVVAILISGGINNADIFIGVKAKLPEGPGPYITIKETGGATPEIVQNYPSRPGYERPSAQIITTAEDMTVAQTAAKTAWDAIFAVKNTFILGTWWRSTTLGTMPFPLGEDAVGRSRVAFNFDCVKRSSPLTSV